MYQFKSCDKDNHERWAPGRDPLNFPGPYIALLIGKPNRGKTACIKSMLCAADPPFDEIIVVYPEGCTGRPTEYDIVDPTCVLNDIPSIDELEEHVFDHSIENSKRCMIIDDIELSSKCPRQRIENLNTLLRYGSSHKFLTIYVANQSFFDLPPICKKMASVVNLWQTSSRREMKECGERIGVANLPKLFEMCCNSDYDSLCFDMTPNSPYKLRKNMVKILDESLLKQR